MLPLTTTCGVTVPGSATIEVKLYCTSVAVLPSAVSDSRPPVTDRPANAGTGWVSSSSCCRSCAIGTVGYRSR